MATREPQPTSAVPPDARAPSRADAPAPPAPPDPGAPAAGSPPDAGLRFVARRLPDVSDEPGIGLAVGLAAAVVALAVKGLFLLFGVDIRYLSFIAAVVIAAGVGGFRAGVVTTVVSGVVEAFVFEAPVGLPLVADSGAAIRLVIFVLDGLLLSWVSDALIRARRSAERRGGAITQLYDAEAEARRASDEAAARNRVLYETVAGLSDALTPGDVARVVVRQGVQALGAIGGAVHAVAPDGRALELLYSAGYPDDVRRHYECVPLDGDTAIAEVARTGRAVYLADRREIASRYPHSLDRAKVAAEQAFAGLPVTVDGRTVAVVSLGFDEPREFRQADRDLHATLAEQTGQALERARLYEVERAAREQAERTEARTAALQAVTAALSGAVTVDAVADVIVTRAIATVGAWAGGVVLVEPDGRTVRSARTAGYPAERARRFLTFPLDGDLPAAVAIRTTTPVFCGDLDEVARDYPTYEADLRATPTRAIAVVPFAPDPALRGAVTLSFTTRQAFGADDRAFMLELARECGEALLRAQLHELEREARAQAEASRGALALVAEASRILAESLDYERTLQHVAQLVVGSLADWCSIDIVGPDGRITSLAAAHRDPDLLAATRGYRAEFPPDAFNLGPTRVVRTGRPVHLPVLAAEDLDAGDPRVAAALRRIGSGSYLCVPVPGEQGHPIGAVTFGAATPGRLDDRAAEVGAEIARRLGVAVEHSRLYRDARQLVATVDQALDAVFVFEPAGLRFIYVNQGAANQVGWSRAELVGMSALAIKPDFDEATYRELIEPLLSGRQTSIQFSTTHLHRDGTRVPVEAFLQAVSLPGGEVRVIVTARDIRQQIEVEANLYRLARAERARAAELSAVIRGMGEGVLVCDPAGQVILSNPAAATILGTSVESYAQLLRLLDVPADRLPRLATLGGPVEARLAGSDRWLDLSTYPVSLDAGDSLGDAETTIIVLRDVTAARRARAAREAFIGVMSHELRTPITTIYGTTKLFNRAGESPERMRSMLTDVEAEADRLYRLVEDLLILSRSESGIEIEPEPVLLQHVVRAVISAEAPRWPDTRFTASVPAGLPPVMGDRTHLEQVVRNLLSNAAKYSPAGALVEVSARVEGAAVAVRVLDNGLGFAGDEAEHLFELFYRSPATAKKASGAGIGLYVCRALIEAMGGRIWARSRPEGGAEFGFTVPVLEPDLDDEVDVDEPTGARALHD